MATWRRDNRLTGSQRLLCAGLAGALSLTLTAPLELATVLAQVSVWRGHAYAPWATARLVWQAEGLRALWKGNAVACLRLVPCSTVQLAAYRKFVVLFTDDLGHISQWSSTVAGSLAGMVSTIVMYPTDLIKTRLIVQNMLEPSYRGLVHAFTTIYRQEGFLALYRGVSLAVLGALPFSTGSLLVYMNLEKIWNGPRDQFTLLQNFTNVCLAAAVSQTLSFPFDTAKRKMQAQSPYLPHYGGVDVHFSGAVDCFRQIVKTQGVLGLWNGLTANLLKVVPYFGVMFSTFEFFKRIFLYQNGYIMSPLSYKLTPGVDQSLKPQELREIKKFFKTGKLKSRKPTL
ncbi:solute carrier family 25 member 43 [Perognathus longimembris pacificus]|uniref:solute carrier family 25 member 43 n=1 Tax=Perognathus longimembris pacificus TaxID=214514 RepID=UPI0020197653|nr:solute carrier family 25 member 43 [Perognathus longimembris pacificus]